MTDRQRKVAEELRIHIATFVQQEANTDPLITITGVNISPDLKNATVHFTTIPSEREEDALIFLKREGTLLRTYIKKHTRMKFLPHFSFSIDYGERHRQHLDDIVRNLEKSESDPND